MSYQAYGSYQGSYNYDPPPETLLGTYPATDASEPHLLTTYSQNHPEILGSGYANSGHVAYADGHSTYQQETEHHLLNPYSAAVSLDPRDIPYSLPQGELLSNYNIQSDHRWYRRKPRSDTLIQYPPSKSRCFFVLSNFIIAACRICLYVRWRFW